MGQQPAMTTKKMKIVVIVLSVLLIFALVVGYYKPIDDGPTKCSVELVGARGLGSALAPGAESPAFKILVHIDNGHYFGLRDDAGSSVVVSYASVPLACGGTPAFYVEEKKVVTVAVDATSDALGIPEDLFHLMSAERQSGVAQLEIDLWLPFVLFTCSVDLDGQRGASRCYETTFIYSS